MAKTTNLIGTLEENQKIYEMQLHEMKSFHDVEIFRVPGGWIYTLITGNGIFIPLTDESKKLNDE